MQETRSLRARTPTGDCSGYFRKQIFETYENRCRKPQCPFLRFLNSYDVDRNSIAVRKWIGNNLKSFAIHLNVVGRTVPEGFDPDAVVSGGFGDLMVHGSAYFLLLRDTGVRLLSHAGSALKLKPQLTLRV